MRIAAVGDIHFTEGLTGTFRRQYERLPDEADVLLLAGDLTNMGRPSEAEALLDELAEIRLPMIAVLGNHDHASDASDGVAALLEDRGVHVLDGNRAVLGIAGRTLGVVGVKGFCGGFEPFMLRAFGERELKAFIAESDFEAKKLEAGLRQLQSDVRIALLHYAPVRETMGDEPPEIYPFLGTSLLLEPIERGHVDAVFHGHAHRGTFHARTPKGIPVYNVAMPVMRRPYCVITF